MVAKVEAEADADKFYNSSSSAAGTRVCKEMQDLKVLAGDIRKDLKRKRTANKLIGILEKELCLFKAGLFLCSCLMRYGFPYFL